MPNSAVCPAPSAAPPEPSIASLPLGPALGSARAAREFTDAVLCTWGMDRILPDARLVVSELVTNAVRHGLATVRLTAPCLPRPLPAPIRLRLLRQPAELRCEVTDPSDIMPVCLTPDDNAEIGRGLCLIAALSNRWGVIPLPTGGKCVWAGIRLLP